MPNYKINNISNEISVFDSKTINTLLKDRTTNKNIVWATDDYLKFGYDKASEIKLGSILDIRHILKMRMNKSKRELNDRVEDKAEVFTPSWVCNEQNNLIDESWFCRKDVFNIEVKNSWKVNDYPIRFPDGKSWKDYVIEKRLEVSCGEAPYLVSRYDTVSGRPIDVPDRIGLLDRKLRVVSENVHEEKKWIRYTILAFKSIYGYDLQGDNVFLSRLNLLQTFWDYYHFKFDTTPNDEDLIKISCIISWNIWQMDGLKYVVPNSCDRQVVELLQLSFFDINDGQKEYCPGCESEQYPLHNGVYCKIKDWDSDEVILFKDLFN